MGVAQCGAVIPSNEVEARVDAERECGVHFLFFLVVLCNWLYVRRCSVERRGGSGGGGIQFPVVTLVRLLSSGVLVAQVTMAEWRVRPRPDGPGIWKMKETFQTSFL